MQLLYTEKMDLHRGNNDRTAAGRSRQPYGRSVTEVVTRWRKSVSESFLFSVFLQLFSVSLMLLLRLRSERFRLLRSSSGGRAEWLSQKACFLVDGRDVGTKQVFAQKLFLRRPKKKKLKTMFLLLLYIYYLF